jgi:hypothetical protein
MVRSSVGEAINAPSPPNAKEKFNLTWETEESVVLSAHHVVGYGA